MGKELPFFLKMNKGLWVKAIFSLKKAQSWPLTYIEALSVTG